MKKLSLILLLVVIALMFSVSCCYADEVSTARIAIVKKTGGFFGGLAAGLISHELLGHETMAKLEGADMHWNGTKWSTNASPSALRNIAMAGFGAQVLSTEILLGVDAIPKDNSFVLGWLTYNILNAVYYTAADSLQKGGCGDFETLRNNGTNTDLVKIGLLAHAALSAYRIYKNPKFIPYVEFSRNELVLGLTWRW